MGINWHDILVILKYCCVLNIFLLSFLKFLLNSNDMVTGSHGCFTVSTRCIWSGGYFGLVATTTVRREIFDVSAVRGKYKSARFTKFVGCLHWGVSFSWTEISLILKNKMAFSVHFFENYVPFFYWLVLKGTRLNLFIGDVQHIYMSSTTLQTFDLEALNSRSSTNCQSTPHSGL